jgi:predicted nucleotidyltransferase component of viral defense system
VIKATKGIVAGRRYLDLQREAKRTARPTDDLIQLYALECFLDRLVRSKFADKFVLKGGVLLAALDARRPTRDIDLAARAIDNSVTEVLHVVRQIADIPVDDGLQFDSSRATAEAIREDDNYTGVRVTLGGVLSRAIVRLHIDVNVGDPIWPEPRSVRLPRLLDGELEVHGYPLEMVLAEKIVTAIERGSANTRWRDFVDIYALTRRHPISAETLRQSLVRVADHRQIELASMQQAFTGYAEIAQSRWSAWHNKNRIAAVSGDFATVLAWVQAFAGPVIAQEAPSMTWDPIVGLPARAEARSGGVHPLRLPAPALLADRAGPSAGR